MFFKMEVCKSCQEFKESSSLCIGYSHCKTDTCDKKKKKILTYCQASNKLVNSKDEWESLRRHGGEGRMYSHRETTIKAHGECARLSQSLRLEKLEEARNRHELGENYSIPSHLYSS